MKSFNYVITDEVGIHARPAGLLVKEAKKYESTVTIVKGDRKADARKLMMLMSLGVKCGEEITVEAEGPDEDAAAAGLEKFFEETL
ncbi:MAG: PTS galactitol transporter subunit IIC [Clostridium sp. 44_14]|uniref:HPr family phosphocarrier protein n=1 Tax=Jutongia sp. TaxID=2944204 RepID=UPI00033F1135|nr:MAG: PTS galactitol transporter subunit IIC [Clostridium sp. 44_14]CDE69829.1 phosphocarrier protein PtsH [Clostridium sp. CAG:277]